MTTSALRLEAVTKSFPGFLLSEISLDLPCGYIMGLVGPNGAGKTTTIALILDQISADSGTITVFGQNNSADEALKEDLGIVFDSSFFVQGWSVNDVEKAISPFYKSWSHQSYSTYCARFGLSPTKKVNELSRGMKVKLMLACAFSHDARLLILDEPTSGLDPATRDELMGILQEYVETGQHSVLFSTHVTADVEKVADFVTVLDSGHQIFTGTVEDLQDHYLLIKGGPSVLSPATAAGIFGIRQTSQNFEGLIKTTQRSDYPGSLAERPSIDQIITYLGRAPHGSDR